MDEESKQMEEARNTLVSYYSHFSHFTASQTAVDCAIVALGKQIGNKPKIEKKFLELAIGKCSCGASCDSDMKYCNECGQKLDWSDFNE